MIKKISMERTYIFIDSYIFVSEAAIVSNLMEQAIHKTVKSGSAEL